MSKEEMEYGSVAVLDKVGQIGKGEQDHPFMASGVTGKDVLEVARSVAPYLVIMLGMLLLITYVPWISLVLTRFVE